MKYFLLFVLACALQAAAFAQNCTDYYFMQNNKTVEMSLFNKKGSNTGRIVYNMSNVTQSGSSASSTVKMTFFDDKGKTISEATNNVKCSNGVMMMDMKMFIPSAQQQQMGKASASASDVYLEYPASMKEGDALKDGQFSMDFKMESGINASVSVSITNRKVEGKESVTTPAGTWDCFRITQKTRIVMKMGIGIPINSEVTEWYAPGFGIVKSEAKGSKTEITSVK
jgi:hypothetical protein